jgi:TRAP-type mannitol/chloroaromatic compound transport system permease small subunit
MFIVLFYEVVARYAFDAPTIWAHQIAAFLFGSYILLGGGYALMLKGHVNMGLIYDQVSERKRAVLDLVTAGVFFLFIAIIVWSGFERSIAGFLTNEKAIRHWEEAIIWPFYFTLPIGGILIGLAGINKLIRDLYMAIKGRGVD